MDLRTFNEGVIDEFRANGGRLTGTLAEIRVLLLTTTGARTGKPHTTPVAYIEDSPTGRMVVFASNRGAQRHPDWLHNLRSDPEILVELGTRSLPVYAEEVGDTEYAHLRERFISENPDTEKHQEWTERRIPLVGLRPR